MCMLVAWWRAAVEWLTLAAESHGESGRSRWSLRRLALLGPPEVWLFWLAVEFLRRPATRPREDPALESDALRRRARIAPNARRFRNRCLALDEEDARLEEPRLALESLDEALLWLEA